MARLSLTNLISPLRNQGRPSRSPRHYHLIREASEHFSSRRPVSLQSVPTLIKAFQVPTKKLVWCYGERPWKRRESPSGYALEVLQHCIQKPVYATYAICV